MEKSAIAAPPFFTVVIPCYNYAHVLERAVTSVQRQDFDAWEIIIIDDGSSDNSAAVAAKCAATDHRISTITQQNSGPARARNHGVELAHGEYVIFLDADDELADTAMTAAAQILGSDATIDCVVGGHVNIDSKGRCKTVSGSALPATGTQRFIAYLDKKIRLCNGAMAIKRRLCQQLPFDEDMRNCEDIPFFAHVLLRGNCVGFKEPMALIHKHADSLRHNDTAAADNRLLATQRVFADWLPPQLLRCKNKYLAKAHLSLFRTMYRNGDKIRARRLYHRAIAMYPPHVFDGAYLFKYLRSYLF